MSWFRDMWKQRKHNAATTVSENDSGSAQTFAEATGGGWGEPPNVVATDGGSQAAYVKQQLELAAEQAQSMAVGEEFTFLLTDIPRSISSPHEIVAGLIVQSYDYGLEFSSVVDEEVRFRRYR